MMGSFVKWNPSRKNSPGWYISVSGCHIWTGTRMKNGYAVVHDPSSGKKKLVYRLRYEREVGPIPEGLELDHFACDNGKGGCCNPHHCRPVSHRENILRSNAATSINAAKTHCVRGHPLSGDNLSVAALKRGERECLACARARWKKKGKGGLLNSKKTNCPQGHEYTEENLSEWGKKNGVRQCRICANARYLAAKSARQNAKS